jgi:hypothetical protein
MESHATHAKLLPEIIPVFPLAGVILLPRAQLPLNVFEPRYLAMVDDALKSQRLIGIVQPTEAETPHHVPALYTIGGIGRITSFAETDDGRYLITLTGMSRFAVEQEVSVITPYRQVQVNYRQFLRDRSSSNDESGVDRTALLSALQRYFAINRIESDWDAIERAPSESLVNSLSMIAPIEAAEKQALLEAGNIGERSKILVTLIELALADAMVPTNTKLN